MVLKLLGRTNHRREGLGRHLHVTLAKSYVYGCTGGGRQSPPPPRPPRCKPRAGNTFRQTGLSKTSFNIGFELERNDEGRGGADYRG